MGIPDRYAKKRVLTEGQIVSDSKRISEALRDRYPLRDDMQIADILHKEMGLDPYKIKTDLYSIDLPENTLGTFNVREGKLRVSGYQKDRDYKLATIFHELGHVGDSVTNPGYTYSSNYEPDSYSAGHFKEINSDRVLRDTLEQQELIERTGLQDPQMLNNLPWLKKVAPYSSNILANPWREKIMRGRAVPPAAWNASYSGVSNPAMTSGDEPKKESSRVKDSSFFRKNKISKEEYTSKLGKMLEGPGYELSGQHEEEKKKKRMEEAKRRAAEWLKNRRSEGKKSYHYKKDEE